MSHGYSTELRERAMAYYDSGKKQSEVCSVFKVGLRTFGRWVQLRRDLRDFSLQDRPKERKKRKLDNKTLTDYVTQNPDHYLWEIARHFNAAPSSVHEACKKLGLSRKKNKPVQRKIGSKKAKVLRGNSEAKS